MANRQGALVNQEGTFRYNVLRNALGRPAAIWSYADMAFRLGMPYDTFQKRMAKNARRLTGFIKYWREGGRSFLQVDPKWSGWKKGDVERAYREALA
jgi:hypothetical protein